jgi:LysM repeat protein
MAAPSGNGDLDQEYAQVRKIALKDPRVQEAFRKADERLDEKILEIDPTLKPIVERHAAVPATADTERTKSQPAASPVAEGRHHIVAKGETLGSIAAHYDVKVAILEKVNHITDDRKLQVGQKLLIPSPDSAQAQPSSEAPETQPGSGAGLWDRLKSSL